MPGTPACRYPSPPASFQAGNGPVTKHREHLDTAPGAECGLSRPQQCANHQRAWISPKLTTAQRMLRPGKAALRVVRPVGKVAVPSNPSSDLEDGNRSEE